MAINAEVTESDPHIRFKLDALKTYVDSLNRNENKDSLSTEKNILVFSDLQRHPD